MPRTRARTAPGSALNAGGDGLPKYARVAAAVRGQIAAGALLPGQPAPSGAALSRLTGFSTLTCRRALRVLIADGLLTPGPSRNARPRVAGAAQQPAERDLAAAKRALSAGLAARRRALGLTQPELAALTGVSVTLVGHAETGRLWQSRRFWERADAILDAAGALITLHDTYRQAVAAAGRTAGDGADNQPSERVELTRQPAAAPSGLITPTCVMIVWGDGSVTTVHPPKVPAWEGTPVADPHGGASGLRCGQACRDVRNARSLSESVNTCPVMPTASAPATLDSLLSMKTASAGEIPRSARTCR